MSDGLRSLLERASAEGDEDACKRCGEPYALREGQEATPFCDPCAHIVVQQFASEIERSFQMLEVNGVPRGRAGTVSNGIEVLMARMRKAGQVPASMLEIACPDCGCEIESELLAAAVNERVANALSKAMPILAEGKKKR